MSDALCLRYRSLRTWGARTEVRARVRESVRYGLACRVFVRVGVGSYAVQEQSRRGWLNSLRLQK
eukprot:9545199-Alexandrium_andersonii.AAC.1